MKSSKQRVLSLLLSIILLLSNISPAFAASDEFLSKTGLTQEELASIENKLANYKADGESSTNEQSQSGKLRVVVELKKDPIVLIAESMGKTVKDFSQSEISTYEKRILAEQDSVKQKILSADIKTYTKGDDNKKSDYSYTTVINGFSTYIDSADLDKLSGLREVKNVYIVNEYNRPAEVPNMLTSGPQVGADGTWNLGYKGEGMVVSVLDSGYDINHKDFLITDPSKTALKESDINTLIGLNNLPGKYYTDKFPYAYNYYDNTDKIKSDTSNHGQHVAGTIAANGDVAKGGIKGIAPEAQLLGMKVFSDDPLYSTTFSDVYVKAIDDSIKLKADAINMSLGSPAGSYIYGSLEDVAITNARNAGIIVAIAAGNEHSIIDGIENFMHLKTSNIPLPFAKNVDTAVVGSPSLYQGDISVASINNTHLQARILHYQLGDEEGDIQISPAHEAPNPWEVLTDTYTGSDITIINKENKGDKSNAPGDALSFEGKDIEGKILLIERGNTFTDTIVNAQTRGAKAVIIYNNERKDDELMNMAGGDLAEIPFFQIVRKDGLKIIDNLDTIKLTFPDVVKPFEHPKGGFISDFSSIGPTPELGIKPEITAPGGDIYSTDNDDSYVNMSGTSMATPHVAGAVALVGQRIITDSDIFGNISKEERGRLAKILLLNTSRPIVNPYGDYYAVRQQGSGLMDLVGATTTDTYVVEKSSGEAKAEVGSFTDNKITIDLTIFNKSKENRRFAIHANALTDAAAEADGYEYLLEASRTIEGIKVSGGGDVIVPRLGKKDVRVTIDLSEAIASGELSKQNFVEGFVFLDSKDKKVDLSVPYLGFYGNYEELNVLDEPITNLYDDDKANDPMFTTTHLYYMENSKVTYAVTSHTPVYFNPKVVGYGNSGLVLRTTPLRNYDRIEYSIEDKDGNVLENLGQSTGGRKITKMITNTNPFRFFDEGKWDGTINGKPLEPGKSVYYTAKAFYLKDSKPQVIKFEVRVDDTFPQVKDINGDFRSRRISSNDNDPYFQDLKGADLRLAYDKESREISFEAYDTLTGIDTIYLGNPATYKSDDPQIKIWQGKDELDTIRELVDKEKRLYKYTITIPEEGFDNHNINVEILDKANNLVIGTALRDEIEPKENSQQIYSFNENTRILRLNVKPGSSAFLVPYGFSIFGPSLEFENLQSFEDFDNDGIIEGVLDKKYKAKDVFLLINNGNQIKYVLPAAEDKSKPLAPILDKVIDQESIGEITGRAYEADMTIKAYANGKLVGEGKSDDDGFFKLTLDEQVSLSDEISVTATRDAVDVTSDPAILAKGEIKAPAIDGENIAPEDTRITGDAFLPFVDVVFEKLDEDGKKEEFARVKSETNGKFILSDINLADLGLDLGDKVFVHIEKDGEKSAETELTIALGEGFNQPGEKLTMYINSPGLTSGYNEKVPFDITLFGWDNLDRVTFNDQELPFTVSEYQKVVNPKTGEQAHYGKTYNINHSLDLEEGYYDIPITAYDDKNDRKFGLTRRFWVDKTKPEIDVITSDISDDQTDVYGDRTITIRTQNNEVNLNFLINDNGPEVLLKRDDTQIYTSGVIDASGFAFEKTKASVNDVIKLGDQKEVTHRYTSVDIADNATKLTVKVIKEDSKEESTDRAPIIKASDRTAYVGESLNLLYQVSATDYNGKDLTDRIKANPDKIDTSKPGQYQVKYEVIDEDGNYGTKTVTVKVIARQDDLIDKSELIAKIEKAKQYQAENYSLTSYQALQEAIKNAEYELKSVSLTEDIVNVLIADLDKAINDLVDISKLRDAYDNAKTLVEAGDEGYNKAAFDNLSKLAEDARVLLAKENPSNQEVLLLTRLLQDAIDKLYDPADKSKLQELYESIKASRENGDISADTYQEESIAQLDKALEEAKTLLEDPDATNDQLEQAYKNLLFASQNLVEKSTDNSVNKDLLELFYVLFANTNLESYTEESVNGFKAALEAAYQVLVDENANQEQVDQAVSSLVEAYDLLEENQVNKEALEKAIKDLMRLKRTDITDKAKVSLDEALKEANDLLAKEDASQQEVDELVSKLNDLIVDIKENETGLRNILRELVEEAEDLINSGKYTDAQASTLEVPVKNAKAALRSRRSTDAKLRKNIDAMRRAIKTFNRRYN